MLGAQETVPFSAVGLGEEGIVIAFDIQNGAGLALQRELRPGEGFAEFVPGAKAAGQGEEGAREIGHEGFAFVHGGDHVHLGEAGVGDFQIGEGAGDDPDDAASSGEAGIGEDSHQSDISASVDQRQAALGEESSYGTGALAIGGVAARTRAAKDAEGFEHGSIVNGWGPGRSGGGRVESGWSYYDIN